MPNMTFEVIVDIPAGRGHKYEVDHETGTLRRAEELFTTSSYPCESAVVE